MPISQRQLEERKMRQNRILEGALSVFKEKGLDGATMDQIATAAGLVKQLFTITLDQRKKFFLQY